jgi:hypothetical protein
MRQWVYQKVVACSGLGIPDTSIFMAGSAGLKGEGPTRPFIVIRGQIKQPALTPSWPFSNQLYQIWVHDQQGSMTRIDGALSALRSQLPAFAPADFGGKEVRCFDWQMDSDDLYDDHYKTSTRHGDFLMVHNG